MATGITEQDVFEAADVLLARGDRPTIERVRLELGRGSPNTVNRHLDAWWATLARRMAGKADAENLPAPLAELCRKLYDGIRQLAGRDAQQALDPDRDNLLRDRQQLESERQLVIQERTNVSGLIQTLRADLANVSAQNSASAAKIAALETSLSAERTRANDAELRAQAVAAEAVRGKDQATREMERVRAQWEGNERHWLTEIDELRTASKRAAADKEKDLKLLRAAVDTSTKALLDKDARLAAVWARVSELEGGLAREREGRIAAESELIGFRRSADSRPTAAKRAARATPRKAR
jgi:chromosome segregation ATPase